MMVIVSLFAINQSEDGLTKKKKKKNPPPKKNKRNER